MTKNIKKIMSELRKATKKILFLTVQALILALFTISIYVITKISVSFIVYSGVIPPMDWAFFAYYSQVAVLCLIALKYLTK